MIWFCLIIPALAVIFLAVRFNRHMAWWEYLLVFGIPLIGIIAGKVISVSNQVRDSEYWNSYFIHAYYYEDWNEYIHQTCTRRYPCGTDDEGHTTYCTETYDCSYVQYHPEYWEATDNIGQNFGIARSRFDQLCALWGNRAFKDMRRDYHSNDGDAYYTLFDGKFDHVIPVCEIHSYTNRVQAVSASVFNFQEVDTAAIRQHGLFVYPKENRYGFNPILGHKAPGATDSLRRYNALYGSIKKLHTMILVFKNKNREAGLLQESLWKGGNKNEFILCVGVDDSARISWTKVISWTENEQLKVRVARKVRELGKLDMGRVVALLGDELPANYVHNNFRGFDYLTVEPTTTAIIVTLIITILTTVGVSVIVVKNDV